MHQVQHFKANFSPDEMADTTIDSLTGKAVGSTELHETDSNVRNLCFVWEDGRRAFFNYAYLVSVDLVLTDNQNEMLLYFSGQIVTLKGYQLRSLFDHIPKTITAINPRYIASLETTTALVIEITLNPE